MRPNRSDVVVALVVSVLAHGMLFAVAFIMQLLDTLERMREQPAPVAAVELEIQDHPRDESQSPPTEAPAIALPSAPDPVTPPAERPPEPPRREPPHRPPRVAERPPEPPTPPPEAVQRSRPAEHRILQSVDQPSESDEPRPDDPHFLSQSNRNVVEETVARARSLTDNDPNPAGTRPNPSQEPQTGTDEQEVARESRDREGVHEPDTTTASPESPAPPEQVAHAGGDGRPQAEAVAALPEVPRIEREGVAVQGQGEVAVARPEHQPGQQGRAGRSGSRGPGRGPNLRLSWSQFTQLYGEGELQRQREEIAELRRTRIRGRSQGQNWERIRAAIENYVPDVRPGNQTALRTAASPFAVYLTQIHRRLHRLWAEGVIVDYAMRSDDSPLNDLSLMVNLEIVINADGSLHKVGVLDGGSGSLVFDAAAVDVVYRSAPHPNPPRAIQSGDGRTYIHWGFYRNQRQCGTFNAEPYILPLPPSMPRDSGEPDEPEPSAPPAGSAPSGAPAPAPSDGPGPRDTVG